MLVKWTIAAPNSVWINSVMHSARNQWVLRFWIDDVKERADIFIATDPYNGSTKDLLAIDID